MQELRRYKSFLGHTVHSSSVKSFYTDLSPSQPKFTTNLRKKKQNKNSMPLLNILINTRFLSEAFQPTFRISSQCVLHVQLLPSLNLNIRNSVNLVSNLKVVNKLYNKGNRLSGFVVSDYHRNLHVRGCSLSCKK